MPAYAALAHELGELYHLFILGAQYPDSEAGGMNWENDIRYAIYRKIPGRGNGTEFEIHPRPAYGFTYVQRHTYLPDNISHLHPDISWEKYLGGWVYTDLYYTP